MGWIRNQIFEDFGGGLRFVRLRVILVGSALVVSVFFAACHLTLSAPRPRTVTLRDGRVIECANTYWHGGGFGPDNRLRCDGRDFPITWIAEVRQG